MTNQFGQGYVPCEVSNRWLQFSEYTDDRWIPISVMTLDKNEKPKKICELILSKEDVLRALNMMNKE